MDQRMAIIELSGNRERSVPILPEKINMPLDREAASNRQIPATVAKPLADAVRWLPIWGKALVGLEGGPG